MKKSNPFVWESDFPPVYGHTSISFLKNCSGFFEAKHGDMHAALIVAGRCVNYQTVSEIKRKHSGATLLPVISDASGNKLPEALARILGMETYMGVHKPETLSRKSLSAIERLLHKPKFVGKITKGKSYVIVDDVITQGGTVSALRKHVIANGGKVSAIVTLSCSVDSKIIAPRPEDIIKLINIYSLRALTDTLRRYGIARDLRELTRAQIRYLARFKDLNGLINKIEKTQTPVEHRAVV